MPLFLGRLAGCCLVGGTRVEQTGVVVVVGVLVVGLACWWGERRKRWGAA